MTTCEIRLRAVEILKERGWSNENSVGGDDGPTCILGALYEAATERRALTTPQAAAPIAVRTAVKAMGFESCTHAFQWNDALDSVTPVIRRLKKGCVKK